MAEDGLVVISSDADDHTSQMTITSNTQGHAEVNMDSFVLEEGNGDPETTHAGGDASSSVHTENSLQNMLLPVSRILSNGNGENIQIVTLSTNSDFSAITQGIDAKAWQFQVLPHMGQLGGDLAQAVIAVPDQGHGIDEHDVSVPESLESIVTGPNTTLLMPPPPPPPQHTLPPGCPLWASRLRDCESIGDSYRGWVENEGELDSLLGCHKQQTQSFWGTRQSPSPAKPSTRLMWKSQYVPFDGIPFVNSGSRAVVMECQYGPRRKGAQIKRTGDQILKAEFRQTCPARIYVKKVRKYPEHQIDLRQDKKAMKSAMDKAFQALKQIGLENVGMERYYIQLPTEKAHEFHNDGLFPEECEPPPAVRLHPKVIQKIRDMVAAGETRVYAIRKQLRRFVEKEVYDGQDCCAEKHNLTIFPTVNDLQNNVHQALKDIEAGILQCTAATVNVEVITSENHAPLSLEDIQNMEQSSWQTGAASSTPHAETVTVTLTQNPSEDGGHIISRVETHLSDGTTQVSHTLTPETAQLLAKLHPNMFPPGNLLQLQDSPLQSASSSQDDGLSLGGRPHLTEEAHAATSLENQTKSADGLQLMEADDSDIGALHVVKSVETGAGTIHLINAGTQVSNQATLQLVQQVSNGNTSTLQLVQAGPGGTPLQIIQTADPNTLQVMQMNHVIQNVHPLISNETLHASMQSSEDLSADANKHVIKQEEEQLSNPVDDNLVSMDIEHDSGGLVLNVDNHFVDD